ncbi:MAG TPA: oxygenase MpaB family protein [Gammaproteobacteria bacterium]
MQRDVERKTSGVPVSRAVNAERLVLLGWPRAILLQFAHPLIAAGIYEHSQFRARPSAAVQRLRLTVRAMLDLTFGTPADRQRTLDKIMAIHRRVHGRLPTDVGPFPAGTPYSAVDPDLVLWVHATLIESVPMFYRMLVAPMTEEQRDAYCSEAAAVAVALGARPREVPTTGAALDDYIARMHASGTIVVGEQAKELADAVLSPPLGPLAAPGMFVNRLLTLGTLPARLREQYGYAWTERDERRFRRLAAALARVRRALPYAAATWRASRQPAPPARTTAGTGVELDQRR